MQVPFLDLKQQFHSLEGEIRQAIDEVLESQQFIQGPHCKRFAENFNQVHGSSYSVGCSNGTSAITIALKGLGIGAGDEVITVANTFIATLESIVEVGAKPVLVDCLPDSYLIDQSQLESKLTSKTKAVIAVHLYGNTIEMDRLVEFCVTHNLKLVEDCAQAHLAKFAGKPVGSFGQYGTFSFYPGKNLGAYGDAGLVVSESKERLDWASMYLNHGRTQKYLHDFVGTNFRMDAIQANILNVKLKYLADWTESRKKLATLYDKRLSSCGYQVLQKIEKGDCVYHLYPVLFENREEVATALKDKGISTGIHYPPQYFSSAEVISPTVALASTAATASWRPFPSPFSA